MSEITTEVNYKEAVKPILKMMTERIVNNFNPIKVILFGSYARGTPNYDSDVDLLMIMPDGTDCKKINIDAFNLLGDAPIAKDVIVVTPELVEKEKDKCNSVLHNAINEGVVLHG